MSDQTNQSAEFLYRTHFGFASAPSKTNPEDIANIAKVLFSAINGDGEITAAERAWVKAYFGAKGYPAEFVAGVDSMTALSVDELAPLMSQGTLKFAGPTVVYDAIRASSADGQYASGERAAVARIGAALGVSTDAIAAIEQLVLDEQRLLDRRVALLFPNGHPNLDARYKR